MILGLGAIVAVIAFVSSVSGSGVFDRYATITPSKVAKTTSTERGNSLSYIPTQFVRYPLGNGLGHHRSRLRLRRQSVRRTSNGESEPGFLLSELGIPGLVVVYGFMLTLLSLGIARIRRFDPEARVYVAALLAGFVGLLVAGVAGATTATAPAAPYTWFAGGVLAYWLTKGVRNGGRSARRARRARTGGAGGLTPLRPRSSLCLRSLSCAGSVAPRHRPPERRFRP